MSVRVGDRVQRITVRVSFARKMIFLQTDNEHPIELLPLPHAP